MKKLITLLLALVVITMCFTGCAVKKQEAAVDDVPNYQAGASLQLEEAVLQAEEAYKTSPTGDSLLTYMDKLTAFKKKWFFDNRKEGVSHEG